MMLACPHSLQPAAPEHPGGFAALMELYEHNYLQLRRLAPVLPDAHEMRVSHIPHALDLHLQSLERSRHTSELILTYHFRQASGADRAEPNLRIRLYHDARLAEACAAPPRHPASTIRATHRAGAADSPLLARWQLNRFLDRWLTYCLRQGHRFPPPPACR